MCFAVADRLRKVIEKAEGALAVVCAGLVLRTIAVADRLLFARSSRYSLVSSILRSEHAKRIRPAFDEGAAASSGCYFAADLLELAADLLLEEFSKFAAGVG